MNSPSSGKCGGMNALGPEVARHQLVSDHAAFAFNSRRLHHLRSAQPVFGGGRLVTVGGATRRRQTAQLPPPPPSQSRDFLRNSRDLPAVPAASTISPRKVPFRRGPRRGPAHAARILGSFRGQAETIGGVRVGSRRLHAVVEGRLLLFVEFGRERERGEGPTTACYCPCRTRPVAPFGSDRRLEPMRQSESRRASERHCPTYPLDPTRFCAGFYSNHLASDSCAARVRAACGQNFAKVVGDQAPVRPRPFLPVNNNIPPAAGVS